MLKRRKRQAADSIYFYRTTNGTEVDFIYDGSLRKFAINAKLTNKKSRPPANLSHSGRLFCQKVSQQPPQNTWHAVCEIKG